MRLMCSSGAVAILALFGLCASGCGDAPATTDVAPKAAASATAELAPSTRVLVQLGRVGFVEGVVIGVVDEQVRYEHGPNAADGGRAKATAERARVWPVADGAKPSAGAHLACEIAAQRWVACNVLTASASSYRIEDRFGDRYDLPAGKLVAVDDATSATIASYLAREARHRAFDDAFKAAGTPKPPPGWIPRADENVVIHFAGTSWYGGKVLSFDAAKSTVRVSYHGGTFGERDVRLGSISPEPPSIAAASGSFALARPKRPDQLWAHVKVVSATGDIVEVVDRDDARRKLSPRDLLLLTPRASPKAPR